jgi:hypothetical protein
LRGPCCSFVHTSSFSYDDRRNTFAQKNVCAMVVVKRKVRRRERVDW